MRCKKAASFAAWRRTLPGVGRDAAKACVPSSHQSQPPLSVFCIVQGIFILRSFDNAKGLQNVLGNVVVVLVVVEHKQGHIGDVHALVVVHHGFVVQLRVLQCGHDDMPQGACRVALGAPDDFATIDNRVALLVGGNAALAVDVVDLVDLALGKPSAK